MKSFTTALFILVATLSGFAQSLPNDPSFFANEAIQKLMPDAFAVQPQSIPFLKQQRLALRNDVLLLVNSIQSDKALAVAISRFTQLTLEQKTEVMKRVFAHEVKVLGITPPALVLDNTYKNLTYFDFDPAKPSAGRVILNPKGLSEMPNPYAPLLFLVHETKHSAQFQLAFSARPNTSPTLVKGYRSSFLAQQSLKGKLSYLDFLTLVNEHDAFQFGNAVMALLTGGKSNDPTMGTFASQFDAKGLPKIDLLKLFQHVGPLRFLKTFNELEVEQWKIVKK